MRPIGTSLPFCRSSELSIVRCERSLTTLQNEYLRLSGVDPIFATLFADIHGPSTTNAPTSEEMTEPADRQEGSIIR
jgi:hypothetical protein